MAELNIANEKCNKRRIPAWEITLIFLGFPLWFSLLVAAFAVVFAIYICLWAIIIALWAVFVSVVACAFGGIVGGAITAVGINRVSGIAIISAGIVCAGLSIFIFFGCKAVTKGMALLTKSIILSIKKRFTKKEAA